MRIIPFVLTVLLATSCAPVGKKLAQLQQKPPEGTTFNALLAKEYFAYAESLAERGHPIRADRYAAKSSAAMDNHLVLPDESSDLPSQRAALMLVLNDDVKEVVPDQAARAQALFDCLANESGIFDMFTDSLCKESFATALADVQFVADTLVHGDGNKFAVHFAPASAAFSSEAEKIMDVVARRINGMGKYKIELVAYGKKPQAKSKTKLLATKRILAVEKALIVRGVNAGLIYDHSAASKDEVFLDVRQAGESADAVGITIQTFGQPEAMRSP